MNLQLKKHKKKNAVTLYLKEEGRKKYEELLGTARTLGISLLDYAWNLHLERKLKNIKKLSL